MDYATFFSRFGASARTKNILPGPDASSSSGPRANKRRCSLPDHSELPREFIRLCPWEVAYLFMVARRASRGILEIGRFNGGSLFVVACAASDGVPIYSIDKAPRDDNLLRSLLDMHCLGANVELIVGESQNANYTQIREIDLLFIDGDHTYDGCMKDLRRWYGNLAWNGHLLCHDSYLGRHGVQDAIIDFMQTHPELEIVQSPFIGAEYWHWPAGSIAHLIKRSTRRS